MDPKQLLEELKEESESFQYAHHFLIKDIISALETSLEVKETCSICNNCPRWKGSRYCREHGHNR